MFGELNPRIPSLLFQANTWVKPNTWSQPSLGATTIAAKILANPTPAASGVQQASPAIEWQGAGFKTTGSVSQNVKFRSYVLGIQGSGAAVGSWKLESSLADASYQTALEYLTTAVAGVDFPRLNVTGAFKLSVSNSSTIDTLQSFDLVNPSGTRTNLTATFGSSIRWGIQIQDSGTAYYKSAGGGGGAHTFQIGSNIGGVSDILQMSSVGLYCYGGSFNQGRVTAGQASTTPPALLNTYGSFAVRGSYKTANATLAENETMVYVDAAGNAICSGTPAVTNCATYSSEGACTPHSGCTWTAEVTESCSAYGGVDQSTCENQSGCTFESLTCAGANNSDQSTCEGQNSAFGGTCSWDTSTCGSQSNTSSCNAISGCSADVSGDCGTLSDGGGDGTSCASQPECSYDSGTGTCSGSYFVSCSGSLCNGNYFSGGCTGTHVVSPAACSGTVTCAGYTSSTPCAAESGCSWTTGVVITLPPSSVANAGNTSRLYSIVNVGASGTVTVLPTSGGTPADTILGYSSGVVLNATNERVMLHHHEIFSSCSVYNSNQSSCQATTGCSWNPAVVCADLSDESSCNTQSGAGCTWDGSACSGAGSSSSCTGNFTASKPWIIHQLSN